MTILITIGWVVGAIIVGFLALPLMMAIVFAPFVGVTLAYERYVSYQRQERIRESRKKFEAGLIILLVLFMAFMFGLLCFDTSNDTFGWPDTPGWMNMDSYDKKKGC